MVSCIVKCLRLQLSCALPFSLAFGACVTEDSGESDAGAATEGQTATSFDDDAESESGGAGGTMASTTSAASTTDASGPSEDESAESVDSTGADDGGSEGGGTIDVTLTGCDIDLGGTVIVSYNGSLGVASVYDGGATLTGSFQFDLDGTGVYELSSQHRVDTGTVVNMVDIAQGTWTNLDSDALTGGVDTIGGTLTVHAWDPASGISDLQFESVSLRNVGNANVCTIDGTIVTTELYP
jgi:hypothetical protein